MISKIEVGQTYVTGNTFNPCEETVEAVAISYCDLPKRAADAELTLRPWAELEVKSALYVRYRVGRQVRFTCEEVFKATRYGNRDAMIRSRNAEDKPGRGGLCRATLPGER